MRRGRPTAPTQQPSTAKPSVSPMRGTSSDPFAALDSQDVHVRRAAADELAARFPSLDDFSLLHDRGQKFEFDETITNTDAALSMRVVEALADDAFASPSPAAKSDPAASKPSSNVSSASVSRTASNKNPKPYGVKDTPRSSTPTIQHPPSQRFTMVSTGVQTSPRASPAPTLPQNLPEVSSKPIWKVPLSSHHTRTKSHPRTFEKSRELGPDTVLPTRPSCESRSNSQLRAPRSPASSRPSLESQRPSALDLGSSLDRSRSANSKARPLSIHVATDLDYLRDCEQTSTRKFDAPPSLQRRTTSSAIDDSEMTTDATIVRSSIDYLRTIEMADPSLRRHRSTSHSKHAKRGSITSMVKGRFGDGFRRFEHAKTPDGERDESPMTPIDRQSHTPGTNLILAPIAGSEANGGLSDDDRSVIEETEDLSPEVRRELEKRSLDEEERRVEAAAAEYRKRIESQTRGTKAGPSKASTIQNRVKDLLDESSRSAVVSRTADGYGKYTSTSKSLPARHEDPSVLRQAPAIARKPIHVSSVQQRQDLAYKKPPTRQPSISRPKSSATTAPIISLRAPSGPPPRAPKPKALQTGSSVNYPTVAPIHDASSFGKKALPLIVSGDSSADNWDVDTFSKRYPSLSGLEMVETEIPKRSISDS